MNDSGFDVLKGIKLSAEVTSRGDASNLRGGEHQGRIQAIHQRGAIGVAPSPLPPERIIIRIKKTVEREE